jgi:site-specific recombinase XerD
LRYLRIRKIITEDLLLEVPTPRIQKKAPYVPTVSEIEAILAIPASRRDKAILELLYSSGLRASELCDLDIRDTSGFQIMVRCGKGGKTRTVPLTQQAYNTMAEYIQERGTQPGPLFQTLMQKKLRRQLLSKIVTSYAKKAGIEGVTTHTLRHACATHLLDQGADLRLIQEVLGHSSIASTQRYTHLSSNKMQEMFNKFHPRKKTCD